MSFPVSIKYVWNSGAPQHSGPPGLCPPVSNGSYAPDHSHIEVTSQSHICMCMSAARQPRQTQTTDNIPPTLAASRVLCQTMPDQTWSWSWSARPRVTIRPGFPGHVLFLSPCPGVRAAFPECGFCPGFLRSSARSIPFYYFSVLYTIKSSAN